MKMLTARQKERYARQLMLPEVGEAGQQKLLTARVLLVGAGGLGSPVALYLAAAGVGTIGIIDGDNVSLSNLQRQILHTTADLGSLKVESARNTLLQINPEIKVITYPYYATADNIQQILADYDFVIDCCDNLATRYLVNDAAVLYGKSFVHGSIMGFQGQAAVFSAPAGPCYRCVFPQPTDVSVKRPFGVMGITPGLIGTIQATEALKIILGSGSTLLGQLLIIDALELDFIKVKIKRDPQCAVCGDHPSITELRAENYQ
ncbi:MAG: molybdopterin-synthase adenylyltransferase MoeB [Firmicutes bacterium]|nr:molybdopterin-synthase adenylyltransferase MoeB [Bacillota bacterium]